MKALFRWLGFGKPERGVQRRENRGKEVEALGFKLIDRRGWENGAYAPRRYFLERNGQPVGGPYSSYEDTIQAARRLSQEGKSPENVTIES